MRSLGQKIIPLRLLILAWLMTWITTVPVFHTHLSDTSGAPAALQGGLPHRVLSPDLPGEFSRSFNGTHPEHVVHLPNRVSNSSERGIALYPGMRSQIL